MKRFAMSRPFLLLTALSMLTIAACSDPSDDDDADPGTDPVKDGPIDDPAKCAQPAGTTSDDLEFVPDIGCSGDFDLVASEPLSAQISGARSVKTVIDRFDSGKLYFQNSKKYAIHWEFASKNLSGNGLPPVPQLSDFNTTEYYSPSRRFILGAVTWYIEPNVWAYEVSPYDTASAEMIAEAYHRIAEHAFFGTHLYFHPTSEAVAAEAKNLPEDVKVITTQELFKSITYQPANLATSTGKLRFLTSEDLEAGDLQFRDIVVLDHVPNDIGVVAGIITAEHQTPLSHINVLSQNRGTPNMVLIGAFESEELLALADKWVELTVGPFEWSIKEVTPEEAEAWWQANKPKPLGVPKLDLDEKALRDIGELMPLDPPPTEAKPASAEALQAALDKSIPAYGGKASHYAGFVHMKDLPAPKAFAIPVFYYHQHMTQNGLHKVVKDMLADASFQGSSQVRQTKLEELRDQIKNAPIDADFLAAVHAKLEADFKGVRMRFRSSTNAEDLDGFTGAGLYTSKTGDPNDPKRPVADAIRKVWASIWNYKAYDERQYRSIDHEAVGMALLSHRSFPEEEANGVALTANIFDTSGLEPGFYINVQLGEESVVFPQQGVTTDQFIYQFHQPGQPIVFISHSSLVPEGTSVITNKQTYELGKALDTIHRFWAPLYGPPASDPTRFYAMDVEFKFDGEPGEVPPLFVKQARPHPGWGLGK